MDIIKFKPKKSYIRVLFKDKVFLMLRRCQMNGKWERRSVLWKGMQVTKNEHTIIGTPVITFSKPCSLYTQQYHQREHLIRHSLISYYSPKPYFVEQRFYEMKRALLFLWEWATKCISEYSFLNPLEMSICLPTYIMKLLKE